MSLVYEKAVKEDLNIGYGTVSVTSPAGGTMSGTKINIRAFSSTRYDVTTYGATGDGTTDDTAAVAAAITAAATGSLASGGATVFFPAGTYILNGALNSDATTGKKYALLAKTNVSYEGEGRASILKLKTNSTSGGADPQMFFSGNATTLANVGFRNLSFCGNSANNVLTGGVPDAKNVCAIYFGSNNNGEGCQVSGLLVEGCYFYDWSGASVVLVHDRRTTGTFSSDMTICNNVFYDVAKGRDLRDHSTVNIFADNTVISNNTFSNPSGSFPKDTQTIVVATELHGSSSSWNGNSVNYYSGGCTFSENLHHATYGMSACGNALNNIQYRGFHTAADTNAINDITISGNSIAFGTANSPVSPYGGAIKYGLCLAHSLTTINQIDCIGNVITGNTTTTDHQLGVAGLRPSGGTTPGRVKTLNFMGNQVYQCGSGVWFSTIVDTTQNYCIPDTTVITGNTFTDLYVGSGSAHAIRIDGSAGNPFYLVVIDGNSFLNKAANASYDWGIVLEYNINYIKIGSNHFRGMDASDIYTAGLVFTGWSGIVNHIGGTAKAVSDALELTNSTNADDMDGTGTGILFNQFYYHASAPATADAGRIAVLTETDWTSTASTQDAAMAFSVADGGTVTERMRITSAGIVGIGTSSPSSKAILDLTSTTLGFLPPRMTTAQREAITSPTEGLIAYDTDLHKAYIYNGTRWEPFGTGTD